MCVCDIQGLSSRGAGDAISVKSTGASGDIAITALQASIVNFGVGVTVTAVNSEVNMGEGIDVLATGGNIQLSTVDLRIDGARALNISGGSVTPPISGALTFSSTMGAVTAQAGSQIELISKSTVTNAQGSGLAVSGNTGVTLKTSNGFDLQANAASGLSFTATQNDFTVTSSGGDVQLDSSASDLSMTSSGATSIAASDGPVVISAGGVNGFATFQSNFNAWSVQSSTANVLLEANNDASIQATDALTLQTTSGTVSVSTFRPVDNIVISSVDITATAQGTRETPQDHLSVWGNNIDLYGKTAITFSANNGFIYVGNTTSPVIAITASSVSVAANDGLRVSSDRQVLTSSAMSSTFSGNNGLLVTSVDALKFTATNPTAMLSFTAKQAVSASALTGSLVSQSDMSITGSATVVLQSTGQAPGNGVFIDSQTSIDQNGVNLLQVTVATLDVTQEVGTATFSTDLFSIVAQNPLLTYQNDLDPSYISGTSVSTTSFVASGGLSISSANPNATLSFVTTQDPANIAITAAGQVTFTTTGTPSNFVIDSNQLSAVASQDLTLSTTDPLNRHLANITIRANGNIIGTSSTDSVIVTADSGGAVFQVTDRPSQMVIQSGTASPVTVMADGNVTISTQPESFGDLTIKTTANGGVILTSQTSLLQFQALTGVISVPVVSDITQNDVSWVVNAQAGVDFVAPAAAPLTLTALVGNMEFRTNSSNSDIVASSTGAAGTLEATCTDAPCKFVATASEGLTMTVAAGGVLSLLPTQNFAATATGTTSFIATTSITLQAQTTLAVASSGYNQATDSGISAVGTTISYASTTNNLQVTATNEVAFIETSTGGLLTIASGSDTVLAAQGNDGRVLLRSLASTVTLSGSSLDFTTGNDVLVSGAQGGITATASGTITLTTQAVGSAITFENDDVVTGQLLFTGPVAATAAEMLVTADQDSSSNVVLTAKAATTFSSSGSTSAPIRIEADLGSVTFGDANSNGLIKATANNGQIISRASEINVAAGTISVQASTIQFTSSEGAIQFLNVPAANTASLFLSTVTTTGVGYGNDIQFSTAGQVSVAGKTNIYNTLQDQGEIFMHALTGDISISTGAGTTSFFANGGVQFINEHGPSDGTKYPIQFSAAATLTLETWGLSDEIDLESDNDIILSSPTVQSTNYQSTLGFFSKTPSPLHVASPWSTNVCVATGYCGIATGQTANYSPVLSTLDAILTDLRQALWSYGLLDWRFPNPTNGAPTAPVAQLT